MTEKKIPPSVNESIGAAARHAKVSALLFREDGQGYIPHDEPTEEDRLAHLHALECAALASSSVVDVAVMIGLAAPLARACVVHRERARRHFWRIVGQLTRVEMCGGGL